MKLAGKCEPDVDTINGLVDAGFDHIELYLTPRILDEQDAIVEQCKDSDANIATVHTPHVDIGADPTDYLHQTNRIAAELNATLVVDSNPTSTRYTPDIIPDSAIDAPSYGYENDPSVSAYYLRLNHLDQGLPLVLDTAHIHMTEPDYLAFIESLLATYDTDLLPVIHLADGTRTNDGLPLGDGTIDLAAIVDMLYTYEYEGTVVLETPQSAQPDALEFVQSLNPDD